MGAYPGIPDKICGSKKTSFHFIQERLLSRLNSWSPKLLSKGGKEILIKLWCKLSPLMLCPASYYHKTLLKNCLVQSFDSGGVPNKTMVVCTGSPEIKFVYQKKNEAWGSEI